jgi:hypothetical protein
MITPYSNIISVTTLSNLLLDTYSGAAAAYSLRGLKVSYVNGPTPYACQVRNSSNVALNIGFVFNSLTGEYELDTAALLSHCTGGNGFVDIWYDQSDNIRNASQVNALNQPQIVSAGSVILENGKPAVQFDGTNDVLIYNGLIYTSNTVFATAVVLDNNSDNFSVIASQATNVEVGRSSIIQIDNSTPRKSLYFFNNGTTFSNLSSTAITNNTQTLLTNYSFNDDYYNSIDGGSANNDIINQSFTPVSSKGFGLGGRPTSSNFWNGKIQELNIWDSDQSANKEGIEFSINNFYSIY